MDKLLNQWFWLHGVSQENRELIEVPNGTTYRNLYDACVAWALNIKVTSLQPNPFYEPSTFYLKYQEGYMHDNHELYGSRKASSLSSTFHHYLEYKKPTVRFLRDLQSEHWFNDMIDAINRASGNAWLFVRVVNTSQLPWFRTQDPAFNAILAEYPHGEEHFMVRYELLRELVSKEHLWKIEPWRSIPKKRSFDLSSYTPEEKELLTKAITCINYLVHLDSWEFIKSEGLMKEYTQNETPNKEIIVDSLFTLLRSKDIFKNAWLLSEITALSKLTHE